MKKVTQTIIGLFLVAAQLSAQGSLSILPRAGLNMAGISGVNGSVVKPGINFGASMEYMIVPKFGFELGLIYSMQGVNFNPDILFPITDKMTAAEVNRQKGERLSVNNTGHDYLNIPILAKLYFDEYYGDPVGFHLLAGGQIDFKAVVDKVGYTKGLEGKLTPGDMNSSTGFSIVFGGGYLTSSGLSLSANINWGVTNAAKFSYLLEDISYKKDEGGRFVQIAPDKIYRNVVFQLNFAYRFSLTPTKEPLPVEVIYEFF
jgi:hypothetical protein